MFFNDKQKELLNKPLDGSRVKTLEKAGRKFSYLPTLDIVNHLNLIFGFDGWETSVIKLEMLNSTTNQNGNFVVTFSSIIQLKVWDENHKNSIIREDNGISVSTAKTLGDAIETSSKACISDGIKRVAKSYGNSMGNPLYDPQQNNVDYSNNNQNNNTQNYNQLQNNSNQQNYQPQQNHKPYTNQQDFTSLINLGLSVVDNHHGNLIVTGETVFENKEIIKQNGFRWDSQNKTWYMPLRQAS